MGSCNTFCVSQKSEFEHQVEEFWNELPIRSLTPLEYKKIVIKEFKNKNFDNFLTERSCFYLKLLECNNYKEYSFEIFNTFLKQECKQKEDFLFSLTFLAIRDVKEAEKCFLRLENHFKTDLIGSEDNINYFNKKPLMRLLRRYIMLITILTVRSLFQRYTCLESEKFREKMEVVFSENLCDEYILSLFNPVFNKSDKYISFQYFFESIYPYLVDCQKIRENIISLAQTKKLEVIYRTRSDTDSTSTAD
jgi:hypothetical protein